MSVLNGKEQAASACANALRKEGREEGPVEQTIEIYHEMSMAEPDILQRRMESFRKNAETAAAWMKKTAIV